MALRKALSYSKKPARAYTRVSRNKSKAYIKVVPHNKIAKYTTGDGPGFYQGKFPFKIELIAHDKVQVRDNALEAGRQLLAKVFDEKLIGKYYLEIKAHPHHILRNNKTAAGAGADRLSTGMKQSFGIVEGRAAIIGAGKPIYFIACDTEQSARLIRTTLQMVKSKIPGKTHILYTRPA